MTSRHETKNKEERVIIFLDGSNFYHRLKDSELGFKQLLDFDYRKFAEWLAHGRIMVDCIYYVGLVRKEVGNTKSEKLVRDQQKLFANLQKQGWTVKIGYMMKHDKDYKEKGVDVKLAVDILDMAYRDRYDAAIVVSSDTDLIPAIIRVKEIGKAVEHIGFSHRPSFAMQRYSKLSRLLSRVELEQFLPNTLL
ncbi:MAG: NYN domain-containing protein [Candidatus Nealsonbacteria bacterium]|nr:NYN domain-containing protein [Candidatus Nealsonbacteria bacterium]